MTFTEISGHKFNVLYADPPWRFQAWSHRGEGKGACNSTPACLSPSSAVYAQDVRLHARQVHGANMGL
jgi:hypothetical protein